MKILLVLLCILMTPIAFSDDPPPDWRVEADRRIETLRKGEVTLHFPDVPGESNEVVSVKVRQTRHAFKFGTCVNQYWLRSDRPEGEKYREFIARHFTAMVAESAMKWPQTEPAPGERFFEHADAMVAFAKTHDLALRGHTLFWSKIKFKADWMRELEGPPLREAMRAHVNAIVPRYRENVIAWDVNNEMLNARFFAERVGGEIRADIFKWAHAAAPEIPLFVNEYSILNEPDRVEEYLKLIRDLTDAGAKVGGIGIQEHAAERVLRVPSDTNTPERQGVVPLTPEGIWGTLDRLHKETGLPIHITEISFRSEDPVVRGDALDKFFRVAFAHEAVDALMLWGFWRRAHWLGEEAALVDADFNLLPGGKRLLHLLETEWKTTTEGDVDGGAFTFPGFYGEYEGEALLSDGTRKLFAFELKKGAKTVSVRYRAE